MTENEGVTSALEKTIDSQIAKIAEDVFHYFNDRKGQFVDKLKVKTMSGFKTYMAETYVRCSMVKTLLRRQAPIHVRDVHVPLNFGISNSIFSEGALVKKVLAGEKVVINGIAGSGKTMTMKSGYLEILEAGTAIPVFVELRHLKDYDGTLVSFICSQVGQFTGGFSPEALIYGLRNRKIILLLDGFDEVPALLKNSVESQLVSLLNAAPSCGLLVSSRPDIERFERIESLSMAEVQDLTIEQVEEVVNRSGFDEPSRIRFIRQVNASLFDSHRRLLSNPLLCSMMLMTFEEFSEMPSKMHIFYDKAFEVLHRRHDTLKQGFVRQYMSALVEDEFARVFETLCYLSIVDGVIAFSSNEIIEYAEEALEYEGFSDESAESYVDDLIKNVCVLLREGDHVSFIHRSFQEYFAARFVVGRGHSDLTQVILNLSPVIFASNVVDFAVSMNSEVIDRSFFLNILPRIVGLISDCSDEVSALSLFYDGMHISGNDLSLYIEMRNLSDENSGVYLTNFVSDLLPELSKYFEYVKEELGNIELHDSNNHLPFREMIKVDRNELNRRLKQTGFSENVSALVSSVIEEIELNEANRKSIRERRRKNRDGL